MSDKRGWGFEKKGYQQRNIDSLLKIFGSKEATETLTEMAKTKPGTWTEIKDTVRDLKEFVAMGGMGTVYNNLKETMQLQLDQAMAPINNQLNSIVTDTLGPIYQDLQDLATDLAAFVSEGPTGAFWGAMIGSIWGELGQLIGGLAGAAFEKYFVGFWVEKWPKLITDIIKAIKEWWKGLWTINGDSDAMRDALSNPMFDDLRDNPELWELLKDMLGLYDPGSGQTAAERIEHLERDF